MKVLFTLVILSLVSAAYSGGYKPIRVKAKAIESAKVLVRDGVVKFQECRNCRMRTMQAAPGMRLKLADHYVVPPQTPRPATVTYRVDDEVVIRVSYW